MLVRFTARQIRNVGVVLTLLGLVVVLSLSLRALFVSRTTSIPPGQSGIEQLTQPEEQPVETGSPEEWKTYVNEEYGFRIGYKGEKTEYPDLMPRKSDSAGTEEEEKSREIAMRSRVVIFTIPPARRLSAVEVLVNVEPVFKRPDPPRLVALPSERVIINEIQFERGYWYGYSAGVGAWINNIELSTQHNGQLYLIRLSSALPQGRGSKEVEIIRDGKPTLVSTEEFTGGAWLEILLNEKDEVISTFNQMLESFEFIN